MLQRLRRMRCLMFTSRRPKGRPEGRAIEDYVVEDHADHVLASFKTQHEAIEWPKRTATLLMSRGCGT
jgi:hypothetical protein